MSKISFRYLLRLFETFTANKMLLFGLVFLLFLMRLSSSSGFLKNFQNKDKALHTVAVLYQKSLDKLEKAKLNNRFN